MQYLDKLKLLISSVVAASIALVLIPACYSSAIRKDWADADIPDIGALDAHKNDSGIFRSIDGRVVARGWRTGVIGRTIRLGKTSTISGIDGAFHLDNVSNTYDLSICDRDGSTCSIYIGLTRPDPILTHETVFNSDQDGPQNQGTITGTIRLSKASFSELSKSQLSTLYWIGDVGTQEWAIGQAITANEVPFGPYTIRWNGAVQGNGSLVYLGKSLGPGGEWVEGFFGMTQSPILVNQETKTILDVASISLRRLSGTVRMYQGNALYSVAVGYAPLNGTSEMYLGNCATNGTFSCPIPDLSSLPGKYCVHPLDFNVEVDATKCSSLFGQTDLSLEIRAPQIITKPIDGSSISPQTKLTWDGVPNQVYLLDIGPDFRESEKPHLQVYTVGSTIMWELIETLSLQFPTNSPYNLTVSRLEPYKTVDEVASFNGRYAAGVDRQTIESKTVTFRLVR